LACLYHIIPFIAQGWGLVNILKNLIYQLSYELINVKLTNLQMIYFLVNCTSHVNPFFYCKKFFFEFLRFQKCKV